MSSVDGGEDSGRGSAAGAAAPDSTSTPARNLAVKDRECPYCHEWFTSSSLGRHLDQFIKEHKPKPADGKHDVEAIRKTRGVVTRRMARTSTGKRDLSATPGADSSGIPSAAKRARLSGPDRTSFAAFNKPNWLTTGVIPDAGDDESLLLPRLRLAGMQTKFEEERKQFVEERDEGRAARLALTEVLDSIRASVVHNRASSPFDFEFLSQSFPTLVLQLLPAQRTIASSQIIPSADAWPIDPPGEAQLQLLREHVKTRLTAFQREQQDQSRHKRRNTDDEDADENSTSDGGDVEPSATALSSDKDLTLYMTHLESAYEAWASMSDTEKTSLWHLSALRAFAQEQRAHEETRKKLEKAEQLRIYEATQVKRLSSLQQPREFISNPTSATPLPPDTAQSVIKNLLKGGSSTNRDIADFTSLNVQTLIAKWKPSVQKNRNFQKPMLSILDAAVAAVATTQSSREQERPRHQRDTHNDGNSSGAAGTANGDAFDAVHVNGGSNQTQTRRKTNGAPISPYQDAFDDLAAAATTEGDDAHSADASGEDDDDVAQPQREPHDTVENGLDSSILDPSLRSGAKSGNLMNANSVSAGYEGDFGAEGLLARVDGELGSATKPARRRSSRR